MITPSLETFSIASATSSPTPSSPAEIEATLAICSLPLIDSLISEIASTAASQAFFIPLRSTIGFAPAAKFFIPSFIIACARTVAVVVPSPATSFVLVATSFTICAPISSNGSSREISFAIVTPSFVMSGEPNDFARTTFLPFGPSVTLTVSASWFTPASKAFLASAPYLISFAIVLRLLVFFASSNDNGNTFFVPILPYLSVGTAPSLRSAACRRCHPEWNFVPWAPPTERLQEYLPALQ